MIGLSTNIASYNELIILFICNDSKKITLKIISNKILRFSCNSI